MQTSSLGFEPHMYLLLSASPLCSFSQAHKLHLEGLFNWLVPVSLRFIRREVCCADAGVFD